MHTPKATRAGVQLLGSTVNMDRSRIRPDTTRAPVDSKSSICVALRQALDRSGPDTTILFIPVSDVVLGLLLPPWHSPPHPGLARNLVQRGRSWGVGPAASRAPSWVDAGKVSGWEIFPDSSAGAQPEPSPHRVLEVICLLTSAPPASAGQLVMDASWPGLYFILFFFP